MFSLKTKTKQPNLIILIILWIVVLSIILLVNISNDKTCYNIEICNLTTSVLKEDKCYCITEYKDCVEYTKRSANIEINKIKKLLSVYETVKKVECNQK